MKLRPPSPSLVISIIALVVATSGTAVGAVIITNSSQVKAEALHGSDIKKGSILSNRLSKGTQRLLREKAAGGGAGAAGGAGVVAYEAVRKAGPEQQPANVLVKVATLRVPAGAYAVSANTVVTAFAGTTNPIEALIGASGSLSAVCTLNTAGPTHSSMGTIVVNDRQTPTTLSMQMTRTVGGDSEFFVECSAGAPWRLSETSIIATRVGSVQLTEVQG